MSTGGVAADREQVRVPLRERARRHPVGVAQEQPLEQRDVDLAARTSSGTSMYSTSACAPEPTGPW